MPCPASHLSVTPPSVPLPPPIRNAEPASPWQGALRPIAVSMPLKENEPTPTHHKTPPGNEGGNDGGGVGGRGGGKAEGAAAGLTPLVYDVPAGWRKKRRLADAPEHMPKQAARRSPKAKIKRLAPPLPRISDDEGWLDDEIQTVAAAHVNEATQPEAAIAATATAARAALTAAAETAAAAVAAAAAAAEAETETETASDVEMMDVDTPRVESPTGVPYLSDPLLPEGQLPGSE